MRVRLTIVHFVMKTESKASKKQQLSIVLESDSQFTFLFLHSARSIVSRLRLASHALDDRETSTRHLRKSERKKEKSLIKLVNQSAKISSGETEGMRG